MSTAGRRNVGPVNRAASAFLAALIRTYQLVLSPWVTQTCKYYPSCSAYGLEAVRQHGALHGTRLAIWRVMRCNPWSAGGVDYVPPVAARDASPGPDASPGDSSDRISTGSRPSVESPVPVSTDLTRV